MNTRETFDIPGTHPAQEVCRDIAQAPRPLTLVGFNTEVVARCLVAIAAIAVTSEAVYFLFADYVASSSSTSWFLMVALVPLAFIFVPWALVHGMKRKSSIFSRCSDIYRNGTPAIGNVVMMSFVAGKDYACYYTTKQPLPFSRRVRVDYTFPVDDKLHTGTVFLREKTARLLNTNDEICVLYIPDHPEDNMLFPVPGNELCSSLLAGPPKHIC